MKIILEFNSLEEMKAWAATTTDKERRKERLAEAKKISEYNLPTRIVNTLRNAGYEYDVEIREETDKNLKRIKNLGGKSVWLIKEVIK